jgi:uncharacterized protein (TIGR04255 family)
MLDLAHIVPDPVATFYKFGVTRSGRPHRPSAIGSGQRAGGFNYTARSPSTSPPHNTGRSRPSQGFQVTTQRVEEVLPQAIRRTYKKVGTLGPTRPSPELPPPVPRYPDPPIHEVILDLKFQAELGIGEVERIPERLGGAWSPRTVSQLELGPGGAMRVSEGTFAHWVSEEANDSKWITRASATNLTLNSVRPGVWPSGTYVGWPVIRDRWRHLLELIGPVYSHPLRRCGLRYINKLAIADDVGFAGSLTLRLDAPEILQNEVNFQFRQAWSSIRGFEDLAATIVVARLPTEQLPFPEGHSAAVLDIDVYNYRVSDSPTLDRALAWFERAHEAENAIFEACVTENLREQMMKEQRI